MMAGAADTIPNDTISKELEGNPPSLPLYAAGLVITLCGLVAANATLPQPDWGWLGRTGLLMGLGVLFSYGSRQLGIKSRGIDWGFGAIVLLLMCGVYTGQIVLEQFLPNGADSPALRLLSALAWGATIGSWVLLTDNRVLATTIPVMAILGLSASQDLNDPVLVCFAVFILTVLFLLIHQNYLQHRPRASEAARLAAVPRLLGAQFAQAGLCAAAVLLVGLAVIVPAQALFSHLSLAQAIRRLTTYRSGTAAGGTAQVFSDDDNLSIGTGTAWSASADVVMQVSPSDGQEHYWRGRTYDQYTGEGWQSSLENSLTIFGDGIPAGSAHLSYRVRPDLTPGDGSHPTGGSPLTATFHVLGTTSQFYYAANPVQLLTAPEAARYGVRFCRDGRLDLASQGIVRFPYAVVSEPAPDVLVPETQARLRLAGTAYPAEIRQRYLGQSGTGVTQPTDLTFFGQALAEAVAPLAPDRRDPLDEALAIRAWVSQRCVYSLVPPPIPEQADHVRYFLHDSQRGYCDLFASSMAILCRTAGIPARLATGFAPGDPQGGSFNLRAEDKHAWTEVYFPGTGWVAFDATAGSRSDGSVPRTHAPSRAWFSGLHFHGGAVNIMIDALIGLIFLIIGYVLKTEVYDRWRMRRRPLAPESDSGAASQTALGSGYARMTRILARLGLPRRLSETPAEYAARVAPALADAELELGLTLSPRLLTALTEAFSRACYAGPAAPSVPERNWASEVATFEAIARRAILQRFWRRVTRQHSVGLNPPRTI
jgi:transglutaminase-like putative cysteine protease